MSFGPSPGEGGSSNRSPGRGWTPTTEGVLRVFLVSHGEERCRHGGCQVLGFQLRQGAHRSDTQKKRVYTCNYQVELRTFTLSLEASESAHATAGTRSVEASALKLF